MTAIVGFTLAGWQVLAEIPPENTAQFPSTFSPEIPEDVDVEALRKLDRDNQIPEAQRLFDILAWRLFLAINWPAKPDGTPDTAKDLGDATSPRVWMSWMANEDIFRPDGGKPVNWDPAVALKQPVHYLWRMSKMIDETESPVNELNESNQAFTGPLVDQNGNFVRYESYMNRKQYDYIVENELYNQEGQRVFTAQKGRLIEFPLASMGIKLAWKELGPNDRPERFLTRKVTIVKTSYDDKNQPVKTKVPATVGMVGMHVTALTKTAPNWVWSTFEHVDNVQVNDLDVVHGTNGDQRLRPLFSNPDAPTKLVNVLPPTNAVPDKNGKFTTWDETLTKNPTQLTRVVPIPLSLQELNRQVEEQLKQAGSVLQYYQLIGTQWPVQPGFPAFGGGGGSAPESIVHKVPGRIVPVFLVNTTMESYFQAGPQVAGPLEEDDRLPFGFWSDDASEHVSPDRTKVFGTETCVGCHFSAGAVVGFRKNERGEYLRDDLGLKIPIYGKNGSFGQTGNGAYLWQFQLKARQKEPPVKTPGAAKKAKGPSPGPVAQPTSQKPPTISAPEQ